MKVVVQFLGVVLIAIAIVGAKLFELLSPFIDWTCSKFERRSP